MMIQHQQLPPIILASGSPRRKELLAQIGLTFEVIKPDVDEKAIETRLSNPIDVVETLAKTKASVIAQQYPQHIVIGADTIVAINDQILGKPANKTYAYAMLLQLQNQKHQVITGVSVWYNNQNQTSHKATSVWMTPMDDQQINQYIESQEPEDKAGAYAIQGLGSQFIQKIEGCYFNVVGLPLNHTCELIYNALKQ